jgi:hypothetical protein
VPTRNPLGGRSDTRGVTQRDQRGTFEGLGPILHAARLRYAAVSSSPRPEPAPGSELADDDQHLPGFPGSTLMRIGLDTAIEHMHALGVLFIDAGVAHPHVPLTLLRASLQDAAEAVWLLAPDQQDERLLRALRIWYRDFGDRAEYEKIRPQQPGRKTGVDRQADMVALAKTLRLNAGTVGGKLHATSIIAQAADLVGQRDEALRLWSLSSGLAHGRYWARLIGLDLVGATPAAGGYTLTVTASEADVVSLGRVCWALADHGERLYRHRSGT